MRTRLTTIVTAVLLLASASASAQLAAARPTVQLTSPVRTTSVGALPTSLTLGSSAPTTAPAPAPRPGRVVCEVTENGAPAPASIALYSNGRSVATGSCASALELPAGTYDAVVTLESALDRPSRTVRVTVPEGGLAAARASFETAILEVRFTAGGLPAHGLAIVERDGVTVGTLGSGVSARLSAGTYTIVARYRTAERRFVVTLAPEQRRALRADF